MSTATIARATVTTCTLHGPRAGTDILPAVGIVDVAGLRFPARSNQGSPHPRCTPRKALLSPRGVARAPS